MPPEILILALVLLGITTVAVPAIVRGALLPRELTLETIPDEDLTDPQRRYYQRVDRALAALGYFPLLNFVASNLQGGNLTRVYRSDTDAAVLGATCMRGANFVDEKAQAGQSYFEWITKYEDGMTLTSQNATLSLVFDVMPHQIRAHHPGISDPARLKARHDRRAAGLLAHQPRFAHGRDLLEEHRDFHRRWCAFQESRGLLRPDTTADGYRVTPRLAWRGVASFLNPLADNFSLWRFCLAVAAGVGLPAIALVVTRDPALLAERTGLPLPAVALGVQLVAATLAGAAVGWLFHGKSFIWGLLLGYLPVRLLGSSLWGGLLPVLWLGFVADRISWFRSRRELLV